MKWLTWAFALLAALAAVLALVPFLVTANDYVPELENELAARLGEPVSIDGMTISLLPLPHATLRGIAIGEAGKIKVRKVTVRPDVWSLWRSHKIIRSLDFDDVVLSPQALGGLVALTQGDRSSPGLTIENVRLRSASVSLEQRAFGPFSADIRVSTATHAGELTLATDDGAFQARVAPQAEKFALQVTATNWIAPAGLPLHFDELGLKGIATRTGAELNDVSAKLYGGSMNGKMAVTWDNDVTIKGELDLKQLKLEDAGTLFSPKTRLSGRMDAKPVFSSTAARASQLGEGLHIETPFTVTERAVHGLDLMNVAAAFLNPLAPAGATHFDELTGQLMRDRRAYKITKLKLTSAGVRARGSLSVTPSRALSGGLTADLKASGVNAAIPLTISGTLDSPLVFPDTAALLGGAGQGTALGRALATPEGRRLGELAQELLRRRNR